MSQRLEKWMWASGGAVCLSALAACSSPVPVNNKPPTVEVVGEEEICEASADWLPKGGVTPPVGMFKPLPHPHGECPFYRGGWQNFLIATQPIDEAGTPAIKLYDTVDDLFVPAKGPHAKRGTPARAWLGDIKQAGARELLIDQNGHTIYYGIHVNKAFKDFVNENKLTTAAAIKDESPEAKELFFPEGVVEFKSAWQQVPDNDPSLNDYIHTRAWVPKISQIPKTAPQDQEPGKIIEDKDHPIEITVRLLALHVVFTFPGHPEFIWATFEHTEGAPDWFAEMNRRNVAPNFGVQPTVKNNSDVEDPVDAKKDYVLYKAGTPVKEANQSFDEHTVDFDAASQTFSKKNNIYRMFPASKSNTIDADAAITSLNYNTEALFKDAEANGALAPNDKRGHYRLVGAVWMDKPEFFDIDVPLQNNEESPFVAKIMDEQKVSEKEAIKQVTDAIAAEGSDSELSILAGEDRLSSTAMESFTQSPDSFPNCFTCHNTQAITDQGIPLVKDKRPSGVISLIGPKRTNISHVLSQFLLEEHDDPRP